MEEKTKEFENVQTDSRPKYERFKTALFKVSDYFDDNQALMAVRQGMIMLIPLLVLGAMALMLASLPIQIGRAHV